MSLYNRCAQLTPAPSERGIVAGFRQLSSDARAVMERIGWVDLRVASGQQTVAESTNASIFFLVLVAVKPSWLASPFRFVAVQVQRQGLLSLGADDGLLSKAGSVPSGAGQRISAARAL